MLIDHKDIVIDVVHEKYFVFVHSKNRFPDQEWMKLLDHLESKRGILSDLRAIVITDGGAPTPKQRGGLEALMADVGQMKTSVVSDVAMLRFVVASVSLFNRGIRSFASAELSTALGFLEMPPASQTEMIRRFQEIQQGSPRNQFATLDQLVKIARGAGAQNSVAMRRAG